MASAGGTKRKRDEAGDDARRTGGLSASHTVPSAVSSYAKLFAQGLPFPHLQVTEVLDEDLLEDVKRELLSEAQVYFRKKNDLYDFQQTDSLRLATSGALARLREVLYGAPFRSWMEAITGVRTTDQVDISAAQYVRGSHLLCHDDDLSTRRIAFILYLVPEGWIGADGGTLDLFDARGGHPAQGGGTTHVPHRVVSRLTPVWNSIAFFEVNPVSFHAVAEVLDDSKGPRLSVSGWFHGTPVPRPPPPAPPVPLFVEPRSGGGGGGAPSAGTALCKALHAHPLADPALAPLSAWINPTYLQPKAKKAMAAQFQKEASLQLQQFLLEDRFASVMKALGQQCWTRVGPPILRHHSVAASTTGTGGGGGVGGPQDRLDPAQALFAFLTGLHFTGFLAEVCALPSDALVAADLRAFTSGDYTLVCDPQFKEDEKAKKAADKGLSSTAAPALGTGSAAAHSSLSCIVTPCLDAVLCLTVGGEADWAEEVGGAVTYLTSDDELLTVPPSSNTLSLVAVEAGVMSFVKYLTQDAPENRYDVHLQLGTST